MERSDMDISHPDLAGMGLPHVRFKHILDQLREGCQILDRNWRYLYVNDAAARQSRRRKDDMVGRTIMEAYPGIDKTAIFATLTKCMTTRTAARAVNELRHADGTTEWFELSIQPADEGLFVMSLDITAHKRSEARGRTQLRRLNALRVIDLAILSTTDSTQALKTVVEETRAQLHVDAAAVLLLNKHSRQLEL